MITWHTSKSDDSRLLELCELSKDDKRPAAANMDPEAWHLKPYTLLHKIYIHKMFDTGGYGLYTEGDQILGGCGYYITDWDDRIGVIGVRAYTPPKMFKKYSQSELMYEQVKLLEQQSAKAYIVTWNEYNLKLMHRFLDMNNPETHKRSFHENGQWYRDPGVRIQPHKLLPYPVNYNYTQQWITYHLFDESFEEEFLDICEERKWHFN